MIQTVFKTGRTIASHSRALGRRRFRLEVWLTAAVFLALVVGHARFFLSKNLIEQGDLAANSLQVENAEHFREMLGPYSRFEFHHPGPAIFYLYALADWILFPLPSHLARFHLAQTILNLVWLVVLSAMIRRGWPGDRWPVVLFVMVGLVVLSLEREVGPALMRPWGPLIVVLPVTVSVVGAAIVATGRTDFVVATVCAAVLATQTHLGTAPVVVPILALAALLHGVRRVRDRRPYTRPERRSLLLTAVVLVVSYLPPVVQEVTSRTGNLTRIIEFVRTSQASHGLGDVLDVVLQAFTVPLRTYLPLLFGAADASDRGFQVMVVLFLAVATWRQAIRAAPAGRLVAPALWLALGLTTAAARNTTGILQPYLFWYLFGVAGVMFFLAARYVGERVGKARWVAGRVDRASGAAVLALGFVFAVSAARWKVPLPPPEDPFAPIMAALPAGGDERVVEVQLGYSHEWSPAWRQLAGLVLALRRDGWRVCTHPEWDFLIADPARCDGTAAHPLVLLSADPIESSRFAVVRGRNFSAAILPSVTSRTRARAILELVAGRLQPVAIGDEYGPGDERLHFEGWYPAEREWRWTEGTTSRIHLRMPARPPASDRLEIRLRLGANGAQPLRVDWNGAEVGTRSLHGFAPVTWTLELATSDVLWGGINTLEFHTPHARPANEKSSRMLGVSLWSLRFVPPGTAP